MPADWRPAGSRLLIGSFNEKLPSPTDRANRKKTNLKPKSIGDFVFSSKEIRNVIEQLTSAKMNITVKSFISVLLDKINDSNSWSRKAIEEDGKVVSETQPDLKVQVVGSKSGGKVILIVAIFDLQRGQVKAQNQKKLTGNFSKFEVRKAVVENLNVPFISLGKATSFIKDASFEVIMDSEIQRVKIDDAARQHKDRTGVTNFSFDELRKQSPLAFQQLCASAMKGEISMMGNFALDMFMYIWLDFDVDLWSGLFNVTKRTDEISSGNFTTTLEVMSEGMDPFNTRMRLTKEQLDHSEKIAVARRKLAKLESAKKKNKAAIEAARADVDRLMNSYPGGN